VEQSRETYYKATHIQTIQFQIARSIVDQLAGLDQQSSDVKRRVFRLQSRHQLFPQVFRLVQEYVERKVDFQGCHPCELGLEKYVTRMVERLRDAIEPDSSEGEPPLLPVLNRYKAIGSTGDVDFKTTRPCHMTVHSHINQVVLDTATWEASAAFTLEQLAIKGMVKWYARNDHMGLVIPYEYLGVDHSYEPDFLVKLSNDLTVLLEIKGYEDDQTKAKHNAAKRWVSAVNNWGPLEKWVFYVCKNPQLLEEDIFRFCKSIKQSKNTGTGSKATH
jgi:type III restriction enzyme